MGFASYELFHWMTHVYEFDARIKSDLTRISSKVDGTIDKILVKEGDEVSRGDLLAVMNSDGIIHQIEALNADLTVQRAKTEKLKAQKRNLDVELDAQVSTKNEEINSQKVELKALLNREKLARKKLKRTKFNDRLLIRLRKIKTGLEKATIQPGFYFGNDKLLQEIKTRRDSPFGITSIDFPEFHYWLQNQTTQFKKDYLNKKLSSFNPIKDAISALLQILRAKEKILSVEAEEGVYQKKLDPSLKIDLVSITVKSSLKSYPNISSNKYAISIHFNDVKTQNQVTKAINFKISLSSL